jgi:putative colanic acid biosynthesis UDP-glucose lipid carrier transferase
MVTQRTEGLYRLFLLCQIVMVAVLFWFGVWVMVTFYSPGSPGAGAEFTWRRYSIYCGLIVLGMCLEALSRSKNYFLQNELLRPHRLSLRQTVASTGLLVLYLIATKDGFISRIFFFNFVPWLYVALLFSHYYLPGFLARRIFRREEKTVLVGSSRKAAHLAEWLQRKSEIGLRTVGLISDDVGEQTGDVPIIGRLDQLEKVVCDHGISQVILLEFPFFTEANRAVIRTCDHLGVRLFILSDLEELLRHSVTHFEDGGFRFIGLREEPLENPMNRFFKRAVDLAIAIPVILFFFPLLAVLVWLIQRFQSPGPLFHVQDRAGMQNRHFRIYKFRTMRPDHEDVSRQARAGDERVYPAGKWLRKLSLDEVPQFWNVLLGEMSTVGPRPHLVEHNNQFARLMENYHVRAFVKPGITGLAQVRGFRGEARDHSDIENRVACDIEYLENWNISLECGIILRTFAQVLFPPRTAY